MLQFDCLGAIYDDSFRTDDTTLPAFIRHGHLLYHIRSGRFIDRESLREQLHQAGVVNASQVISDQTEGAHGGDSAGWAPTHTGPWT